MFRGLALVVGTLGSILWLLGLLGGFSGVAEDVQTIFLATIIFLLLDQRRD